MDSLLPPLILNWFSKGSDLGISVHFKYHFSGDSGPGEGIIHPEQSSFLTGHAALFSDTSCLVW